MRFGDPETEVIVPLFADDLSEILFAAANGTLTDAPRFSTQAAVTVVLAAEGYPTAPRYGEIISGLGEDGQLRDALDGVTVFHAGTRRNEQGDFVTAGGRVLTITAVADSVESAREQAYRAAATVTFPGRVMRTDIARSVA